MLCLSYKGTANLIKQLTEDYDSQVSQQGQPGTSQVVGWIWRIGQLLKSGLQLKVMFQCRKIYKIISSQ